MLIRSAIVLAVTLSVPTVVLGQEHVYFGNLHSHTSYSDGSGTPAQAYQFARDSAHLDFLAITEHNHSAAEGSGDRRDTLLIAKNPTLYQGPQAAALIPTANRLNRDSQFVTLYGQEFSTIGGGNHVNLYGVKEVINVPSGRFDLLIDWLRAHPDSLGRPIIMQLNHPTLFDDTTKEYGADDFPSVAAWVAALAPHAALIEVLNGPALVATVGHRSAEVMNADFLNYLNRGFRVAPTGDQDNHYKTWGAITESRTGVVAPALTREAILDALRERHVYATEDRNLELIGRVNDHLMGSIIPPPAPGSPLDITLSIHDRDEPAATYWVEVLADSVPGGAVAQVAEVFPIVGNNPPNLPYVLDGVRFQGAGEYLFLRVRQIGEDGLDDRAWTAPVWFDSGAAMPVPASPPVRIVSLVPNSTGDERQTEEIVIKNTGSVTLNLTGWTVRDLAGKIWSLNAVTAIAPGAEKTIRRNNQPMSMNNGGDTIQLLDAASVLVQSVTYPAMAEGQRFQAAQ
jgi:lamin tail-like protein